MHIYIYTYVYAYIYIYIYIYIYTYTVIRAVSDPQPVNVDTPKGANGDGAFSVYGLGWSMAHIQIHRSIMC